MKQFMTSEDVWLNSRCYNLDFWCKPNIEKIFPALLETRWDICMYFEKHVCIPLYSRFSLSKYLKHCCFSFSWKFWLTEYQVSWHVKLSLCRSSLRNLLSLLLVSFLSRMHLHLHQMYHYLGKNLLVLLTYILLHA